MLARSLAVVPPLRWWAGFAAIATFAVFMSGLAYVDQLPGVFRVDGFDKLVHFGTAGLLAFFLDGALRRRELRIPGGVMLPLASVVILVPVGIEEFLQRYTLFRTSSFWDFVADLVGVALFVPLSRRAAA